MTRGKAQTSRMYLWESQREYARCLSDLGAAPVELADLFGCSAPTMRDCLAGQRASTGFRDLTGARTRHPTMTAAEAHAITAMAEDLFALHPERHIPYDRLRRLLAATYEEHHPEAGTVPPPPPAGPAGALERISDTYVALGEQLIDLVDELRQDPIIDVDQRVGAALDRVLEIRVAQAVERYFA